MKSCTLKSNIVCLRRATCANVLMRPAQFACSAAGLCFDLEQAQVGVVTEREPARLISTCAIKRHLRNSVSSEGMCINCELAQWLYELSGGSGSR